MNGNTETRNVASAIGEPIDWAPRLAGLLDEQRRICAELETLTSRQGVSIREGDTAALMSILAERQELINQLNGLNVQMEPYRKEWEWCMGRLPAAQRGAMEGAVRELGEMVDRISARDEADRMELEQQRSAVSAELSGLSRGRVALSAYGVKRGPAAPMYQDRSC